MTPVQAPSPSLRERVGVRVSVIALLTVFLLTAPIAAIAQQSTTRPRIGYLDWASPSDAAARLRRDAFLQGLQALGRMDGQNISIEYRWAEDHLDRLPDLASDLVRRKVDVIVVGSNPAVAASKRATRTIPIVMSVVGDPVGSGFVDSLARPGGNITGLSNLAEGVSPKWVDLLKEAAPKISRVGVLAASHTTAHATFWREIQTAVKPLSLRAERWEVATSDDIDRAFAAIAKDRDIGLIVLPHPVMTSNSRQIAELAAKARVPAMYGNRQSIDHGGFISYGTNVPDLYRRAAYYVDKILKGTKPADLPVEQPTKFELVINLKTAKALGLTIPQSLLLRADEVIR
jgi:putative ABC transport system substrate-binding protein